MKPNKEYNEIIMADIMKDFDPSEEFDSQEVSELDEDLTAKLIDEAMAALKRQGNILDHTPDGEPF